MRTASQGAAAAAGKLADVIVVDGDPPFDRTARARRGRVKDGVLLESARANQVTATQGEGPVRRRLFSVLVASLVFVSFAAVCGDAQDAQHAERRDVKPHVSDRFVPFAPSTGAYTLEHPSDWQAHENGGRVNIGAENGLVPAGRGFRTVYGVIVTIVDDPLGGGAKHSVLESTQAIVETVLTRNAHQSLTTPAHTDGTLAGGEAASAVLTGTSPVTGKGERAEIVCRRYGEPQVFYLILVSPTGDYGTLEKPLRRVRDSIRFTKNPAANH